MKEEQDYIRDITEIRSIMERSTKFPWLSGWAGILSGGYALAGSFAAWKLFHFCPQDLFDNKYAAEDLQKVIAIALAVLIISIVTAVFFSRKKAEMKGERPWNITSRLLLSGMIVPMAAGGLLTIILALQGLYGLMMPLTLIFYGLALINAGRFTIPAVSVLGVFELSCGIIGAWKAEISLLLWASGFGLAHIVYGIFILNKYEK